MTQIGVWFYTHLSQVGIGLLAVNTVFQKLPVAEQNDLIALAGKCLKWVWRCVVSKLMPTQKAELSEQLRTLISQVVKEQMEKGLGNKE